MCNIYFCKNFGIKWASAINTKMRLQSFCFNKIGKMLDFYSQFNPSPLSIKQFLDFGECGCSGRWRLKFLWRNCEVGFRRIRFSILVCTWRSGAFLTEFFQCVERICWGSCSCSSILTVPTFGPAARLNRIDKILLRKSTSWSSHDDDRIKTTPNRFRDYQPIVEFVNLL